MGRTHATVAPGLGSHLFTEAVRRHAGQDVAVAEPLYRALLALQPGHAEASYNLGLILHGQGRLAEAIAAYRHAVALRPDYLDACGNLGVALQASGQAEDAVALYRRLLAAHPGFATAAGNLGVALKSLGRLDEAEAAYRQAIEADPGCDWAYANLAALLLERGDNEAAVLACRRAIALRPASDIAHFNLGTASKALSRLDEAQAALRTAVAIRPDFAEAHVTLGQTLLLEGQLAEGWAEYDWRWRLREYGWLRALHGDFAQPLWDGGDISGRTILVYAEQGLGDAIQFVRYVPRLTALGAAVVLAVHPPLRRLFGQWPGVTAVGLDEPFPAFDVHCPLLTLPRRFATTLDSIPASLAYLRADPALAAQWRTRLPTSGPRVGVVWAGNPTQTGDRFRSPGLAAIRPLFDTPGVSFVALQVGAGRAALDTAGLNTAGLNTAGLNTAGLNTAGLPAGVADLGADLVDLSDTAAILVGLDLLISSCTAPLHLGAALGVPTWGLIPFAPHYPWLMERADSPWYPSLRLYRQERPGTDWSGVVGRLCADLGTLR